MPLSDQKIHNLKKIMGTMSIGQLVNVLLNHNVRIENIRFLPVLISSSSISTVLDIFIDDERLYVKINVFKIKSFSEIEYIFERSVLYNNNNNINSIINGVENLLPIQAFEGKKVEAFIENKVKLIDYQTIDNLICLIYQELREDYCVCINYERISDISLLNPSIIGKSYINSISLGGKIKTDCYIIKIRLIKSTDYNIESEIKKIESRIVPILDKFSNVFKLETSITSTDKTDKEKIDYIGQYSL